MSGSSRRGARLHPRQSRTLAKVLLGAAIAVVLVYSGWTLVSELLQ
jgi:hypothetical protein